MAFIYHIAAAADWERALRDGQYTMSTRGLTLAEHGFIHASTASSPSTPLVHDHEEGPSAARRKSSWSRSRFSATVSWDAMCVIPDSGSTVCG